MVTKEVERNYNSLIKKFGETPKGVGTHEKVWLLKKKSINPVLGSSKNVLLNAGCGFGSIIEELTDGNTVFGIGILPEMLKLTRKNKLKVFRASITRLPFKPGTFDVSLSLGTIQYVEKKKHLLVIKKLLRVTKNNCRVILETRNGESVQKKVLTFLKNQKRRYVK
jgi:ubiquinone/menaquinone biosynthesis C-methylase UbiE